MKERFTIFDIAELKEIIASSSKANDSAMQFMKGFEWEYTYETEDDTIVFENDTISIEFTDFFNPYRRTCSVMYWEQGEPKILELVA